MSLEGSMHDNRKFDESLTYLKTTYAKASEEVNYLKEQLEIANATIEEYRAKEASEASLKEEVTKLTEQLDMAQSLIHTGDKAIKSAQYLIGDGHEQLEIAHKTIREQNEQLLLQNAVMKREKKSEKKKAEKSEKLLRDRIVELEELLEKERMKQVNGADSVIEMKKDILLEAFLFSIMNNSNRTTIEQLSSDISTHNSTVEEDSNGNSNMPKEDAVNEEDEAPTPAQIEMLRSSRHENIVRCVESLVHSAKCTVSGCTDVSCHKMKRVIAHTKECKKRATASCPVCKQLIAVCCYHAKHCSIEKCEVPFCQNLRQKCDEQRELIAQQLASTSESATE